MFNQIVFYKYVLERDLKKTYVSLFEHSRESRPDKNFYPRFVLIAKE